MKSTFLQECGSFKIEGQYEGAPHWHTVTFKGVEFRHLQIGDLHDLAYALNRAIDYHDKNKWPQS